MNRKLQVFVSSTYTDLIAERQAAVAAILKAGHIPAGMELFTAGDKSQIDTIKRWIDQSDVYMLILGGRYGSIEEVGGLSYTELEYDYAVKTGKPLFSVVINEAALEAKVKANGTAFIELENPLPLKNFREKVLSNISSFFSDEKDIKLCVHESLGEHGYNKKLKGWVSGGDVEDTSILREEIRTLREENSTLKAQIDQAARVSFSKAPDDRKKQIGDIINLLMIKNIDIPASLTGGKAAKNTLFNLFYMNRQTLIAGVTNQVGLDDAQSFFYFTLCPELQIFGLTENEKVAGVRYRRSFVTKLGMELLAECERRLSASKVVDGGNAKKDIKTEAADIAPPPEEVTV